jgi:hypothetical protein
MSQVRPEHLFVWLPRGSDTIADASPYFDLPVLEIPPEYVDRIWDTGPAMSVLISAMIGKLLGRDDIDGLCGFI